jgi:hypothetical protein
MRGSGRTLLAVVAALALPGAARAATPIPEGPGAGSLPQFIGKPATVRPVRSPDPPQHPFMAPNGKSNLHEDAFQTDVHQGPGPLGRQMARTSNFLRGVCGSITFDSAGRIVTVCVGLAGPTLYMLDPNTLDVLAQMSLPPRQSIPTNIFQDFAGGGYFYLDNQDRAVIPTTSRHVYVVGETSGPGFQLEHDYSLETVVPPGDKIISALPDWSGRIWFVSVNGVVGTIDPTTGAVQSLDTAEGIGNSFAVGDDGAVYIVTNAALYRFAADATGKPVVIWRATYPNDGTQKSGQSQAGSGTTPTLMGSQFISITDNADPVHVMVFRRAATVTGSRLVCRVPVFDKGSSSTDQSIVATPTQMVLENNYGYTGPAATENGATTVGGLQRVDLDPTTGRCRTVWRSKEIAPSVVPKLDAANGLVYTYTKPARSDGEDAWYFTALDFRSGKTIYKRLAGEGLGYNNNYAPIIVGPNAAMYIGVLGGIASLRDTR